jgi:tripartite-type tricarboxylate transporter receptor subunit TctC
MPRIVTRLLASLLVLSCHAVASAQAFPSKPIRLIVPFAPGGSSEIVARSVAAEMSKSLGQNVFVENKPGGAGTIAMLDLKGSAADGHTLVLGHVGVLAVNPFAMAKHPYDVNKDFAPVVLLARVPTVFVVNASVPARDLREFVALAKSKPGQLNYSSAGNGSSGHLTFEYLKMVADIFLVHIPYRGTGPQLTDLLAGRIEAASIGGPAVLPHVRSGKLRAIAVGSAERVAALPDVGTVAEQGFPGFETSQWYGLLAPAGTPKAVIDRLAAEATRALKSSSVTERFAADSARGVGGTPEQFAAFIRDEQKRWQGVIRRANIAIE